MEWQDEIESKQRELQQLHAKRLRGVHLPALSIHRALACALTVLSVCSQCALACALTVLSPCSHCVLSFCSLCAQRALTVCSHSAHCVLSDLEARAQQREAELDAQRTKFGKLKEDFKFNLGLLEERVPLPTTASRTAATCHSSLWCH